MPYPEALWNHWRIPLGQLLLVKVQSPEEGWRVALETVQTVLFRWVVLRPSRSASVAQLRKLQLSAEDTGSRVLLLGKNKLPHWVCRETIELPDSVR
jgi:hypothetical protein